MYTRNSSTASIKSCNNLFIGLTGKNTKSKKGQLENSGQENDNNVNNKQNKISCITTTKKVWSKNS